MKENYKKKALEKSVRNFNFPKNSEKIAERIYGVISEEVHRTSTRGMLVEISEVISREIKPSYCITLESVC